MHPILLLMICLSGDPSQCQQIPVEAPQAITQKSCAAKAKSEFEAGVAKVKEDDADTAAQMVLQEFFCGYLSKLNDGKPS